MKKAHTQTLQRLLFVLTLITSITLSAMRIAPEPQTRSKDPIVTYYEYCNQTYGTQMPTRTQKYGTAIPYHLYDSLVLHIRDYKIKKDTHRISRRELDDELLYLRGHIQHILTSHPCIAHIKALLVQHELGGEFEFIPESH